MAQETIVDACCVINLLATGRDVEIVRALDLVLIESDNVRPETQFLWTPPDADGIRGKAPTSSARLREAGLLETRALDLDSETMVDAFVAAAARFKDTDASCIAMAGVLGLPLLTDDGKARGIARDLFPRITLVSTLDIIDDASTALRWTEAELTEVVIALRWRGNFAPPRRDARRDWYNGLLARAGIGEL
jgi:hypothetical protein